MSFETPENLDKTFETLLKPAEIKKAAFNIGGEAAGLFLEIKKEQKEKTEN